MPSETPTLPPPTGKYEALLAKLEETTKALAGVGELLIETQTELRATRGEMASVRAELTEVTGKFRNLDARVESLESAAE